MCQINTLRTFRWRHLLVKPERTYAYTWYEMRQDRLFAEIYVTVRGQKTTSTFTTKPLRKCRA
jgi:hypothetical protein